MAYQMSAGSFSQDPNVDWTSEDLPQSLITLLGRIRYLPAHHRTSIVQAFNRIEQSSNTGVIWSITYSSMQQFGHPNPPYSAWDPAGSQQLDGMFQEVDSILPANQYLPQTVTQPVEDRGVQLPITGADSNMNDLGRRHPKRRAPPSRPATACEDGTRRNFRRDLQPIARPVLAQQGYSDRPSSGNSRTSFPYPGSMASSLPTSNPPTTSNASTRTKSTDRRWDCSTPNCDKSYGRRRDFRKHRTKCGTNAREECTYCDKDFGEERSRKRHERDQHHVCHKCDAQLNPQLASVPVLPGHSSLPLRLPSATALKTHDARFHGVECGYCGEHLANQRDLNMHHALVHGVGMRCKLESCDAVLATQGDLEKHYERDHKLKPQCHCSICGARHWTERKLDEHTCPGPSPQPSARVYSAR